MGRPKLKKKKYYYVNFRLTPDLARKLRKHAKRSGHGIAGFMRDFIDRLPDTAESAVFNDGKIF